MSVRNRDIEKNKIAEENENRKIFFMFLKMISITRDKSNSDVFS